MADPNGTDGARGHPSRALVLGGGGPVGRAWQTGLVEGLLGRGIALGAADLIVGTSAGAVVGGRLALAQGFAAPAQTAPNPSMPAPAPSGAMIAIATAMARAAQSAAPEPIRAEIGRMALEAQTVSEEASVSREVFASFVGQAWPDALRITSVNARTGQLQVWQASSGAPLERAIAASTASPGIWPPITIDDDRYIDGGVRSMLNADLALGADIVVAVSCFPLAARDQAGLAFFDALNAAVRVELDAVRASGATVAVVEPGSEFAVLTRHGAAMMDASLAPRAYRLGQETALVEADRLRRVWDAQ